MASTKYHIILCLSNDRIHILTRTGIEREVFVLSNVVACTAHDDYALLILTSASPLGKIIATATTRCLINVIIRYKITLHNNTSK
jgi:hypothetical protein